MRALLDYDAKELLLPGAQLKFPGIGKIDFPFHVIYTFRVNLEPASLEKPLCL